MQTRTTIHLNISRPVLILARIRAWLVQRDPILLAAPIVVSLIIGLALGTALYQSLRPAAPAETAAQPTSALIMVLSTPVPPLPTAAPHMVVAYDQPNGAAFPDAIPEPAPSSWIGRWGDAWIQIQWTPNPVWIRAEDVGASLADVRPVPNVVVAPVAAPPAPAEPVYQVTNLSPSGIVLTDQERADAFAAHNAQQLAWCADKQTEYCNMVRAAQGGQP